MTTYELTASDIKKLEELIKITYSISKLYIDLEELENRGMKETPLFKQKIEHLKIALEVEDNKYQEFELTKEKSKALINYILKDIIKEVFYNNVNSILNKDYENRELRRILNNFGKEYLKFKIDLEAFDKDTTDLKNLSDFINNNLQVQNNFEEETVKFFLEFLEKDIENEKNPLIKRDLIASKYFSSFIFKTVESSMIENDFSKGSLMVSSLFESFLCDISRERYDVLREIYALPYALGEITKILEVKDMLYQDTSIRSLGKIRQYFLRATFLFLDDETLGQLNLSFHETLESKEYKKNIIGETLVKDCFKRINTDRLEIEKITLGYDINKLNLK